MAGLFSISKILFTVVVVAAVWYGFRVLANRQQTVARRNAKPEREARQQAQDQDAGEIEDMVKCSVCGDYVSAQSARSCGRDDCPYH